MNKALKILVSIVLVLLFLFCTIAIVGAFSLDENETINTGRLIAVIVGELIAIGGLIALWRGRSPSV
jgi:multisubunit Na+/H+ antiporter MnhG subunit